MEILIAVVAPTVHALQGAGESNAGTQRIAAAKLGGDYLVGIAGTARAGAVDRRGCRQQGRLDGGVAGRDRFELFHDIVPLVLITGNWQDQIVRL